MNSDHDLLYGLIALQNGMIQSEALVAAFQAWTLDRSQSVRGYLIQHNQMNAEQNAAVELLVGLHLKKHGGAVEDGLATMSIPTAIRSSLQSIGDATLDASLTKVSDSIPTIDPKDREPQNRDPRHNASNDATVAWSDDNFQELRFRILRPHAQGGLGAVYVAFDSELNREVALKEILNDHSQNWSSRQRFLLEAEITGGLEHPGIVPVYGLGSYSDGRPYYAMRFIRGDSLKEAIDRFHSADSVNKGVDYTSIEFRKLLGRFIDVCQAIEYAHSRGVLHRDLKPGNIMLGKYGETLVVDWGLAKAVGKSDSFSELDESILNPSSGSGVEVTQLGAAIGTPAYMSPEQASGRLHELGPATDIYSLGATLFYALAGKSPFSNCKMGELLQRVQAGRFDKPSSIRADVPKSLEAICLKAMSLRASDRYARPTDIAEDLEHWLADEAVSCLQESIVIRTRRWMKRHQTLVGSLVAAFAVLMISLATLLWLVTRHNAELDDKNLQLAESNSRISNAYDAERLAKAEAEQKKKDAELSRDEAKQVLDFMVSSFRKPDPAADGEKVTVAELLQQASDELATSLPSQPRTQARMLNAIGTTYKGLGLHSKAIVALGRARSLILGDSAEESLESIEMGRALAVAYADSGRYDDAITLNESLLPWLKTNLGIADQKTLATMSDIGMCFAILGRVEEGQKLLQEALEISTRELGAEHPETLRTLNSLAIAFHSAGQLDSTVKLYEQLVDSQVKSLGKDHPETLQRMNELAGIYHMSGMLDKAIPYYELIVDLKTKKLGLEHPNTLLALADLSFAYDSAGRLDEQIKILKGVIDVMSEKLGRTNAAYISTLNNLAVAYLKTDHPNEAIPLLEKSIALAEETLGAKSATAMTHSMNRAVAYFDSGRKEEAFTQINETIARMTETLGPNSEDTLDAKNNLGMFFLENGQIAEAVTTLRDAYNRKVKHLYENHPATIDGIKNLADALLAAGEPEEATKMYEAAVDANRGAYGEYSAQTLGSLSDLVQALLKQNAEARALELYSQYLSGLRTAVPLDEEALAQSLLSVSLSLFAQGQTAASQSYVAESITLFKRVAPNHWMTFHAVGLQGRILASQAQYQDAVPFLKEGLDGLLTRQDQIPSKFRTHLAEVCRSLIQCYEMLGLTSEIEPMKTTLRRLEENRQ